MSDHDDHHDDRDRITSLADDMTKRTNAPETAHDSPMLQGRVRIPDGTDRRQWLKQQSKSRRQKRRSSGDTNKHTPSSSSPATATTAGTNPLFSHLSPSVDSSQGDDESDTSCSSSVMSGLSIVSTPEPSRRQRQFKELRFSAEHAASEIGSPPDRRRRTRVPPSLKNVPSPAASATRARQTITRTSSSSSSLSMLGSSSWMRWCSVCEAEFTKLRRPHRCRRCLEAVCASCSPARLPVPGMANPELKRTCRLCAGGTRAPQVDDALARYRPEVVPGADTAEETAGASVGGSMRRSTSVSGMMGSIINRAPLGVLSDVVKAGLYPGERTTDSGAGGMSSGDQLGDDTGVTTPGGSFRKRLSAGGAAALGAIGAGISLAGERSFRRRGNSVGSAGEPPASIEGDRDDDLPGDETGVTTPGGSLRKRLSAGGAAALGAIGAGISLAGERSFRRRGNSVGSAGEPPAGVDVDVDYGSGDLVSSEVGVTTPGGSIRKRLSAGGAAAWGAIGAGIGLSGDKSSRRRNDSQGSAGESPAGVEVEVDDGSGDLYGSEVGVTTPGGSIRRRLSAGGAAAWGVIGNGIGRWSGKSPGEEDDAVRMSSEAGEAAADTELGLAGVDPVPGSDAADELEELEEVVASAANKSAVKDTDDPPVAQTKVVISDAVRIAIGATPTTPTATATAAAAASAITGDEPAKNRLFAPTQEPVITEGPRSDSAPVTPVEVSRDQAAASGAIKVPVDNDEEPQLEQAPVVTGEGAEAEQAEDIPAVVEETAMEDAVENTAGISGDVLLDDSPENAAAGGNTSDVPEIEGRIGDTEQPALVSSKPDVAAVADESSDLAEMPKDVTPVEDETSVEAPIIRGTTSAGDDALVDAPPKVAAGSDDIEEMPVEAERVEEVEQPAAVTSSIVVEAVDALPERAEIMEVAVSAEDNDTSAEADTSVDSTPEQPSATIEMPVVENRAEGAEHPAPVAMVAVSEATGGLPEDGETLDVVSPVEDDDDVTEAPTANASAEGEQPAPSQLTPVVDDAMDEAIGTGQTEIAEQPAPVASEPVVTVADESFEVEKTSEIVASAKDDAVSGAPADNTVDADGEAVLNPSEFSSGKKDAMRTSAPAEEQIGKAEQPAAVASEPVVEVADEPSEEEEWTKVVAPAEGDDAVPEAPIDTVTSATDEAPVNTFSGALIPTEAKILEEKGTGEAVETARDASEAVLEVADEPSETQQTVEVVKDGAVLEAPMDVDTTGDEGDALADPSPKNAGEGNAGADDPALAAGQVGDDEQPGPVASELPPEVAGVSPGVEEMANVVPLEEGHTLSAAAPIMDNVGSGVDAPAISPPEAAVAEAEEPGAEKLADETEQHGPVSSDRVDEAADHDLSEVEETAEVVSPAESGPGSDAPTMALAEAAVEVPPGSEERVMETEEPGGVASEAVSEVSDELPEEQGEKAEIVVGTEDDAVADAPIEETAGDDEAVDVPPGVDVRAEEEEGGVEQPAPIVSTPVGEVGGELSEQAETTDVVTPVDGDDVIDAPIDGNNTNAGAETPADAPSNLAPGVDSEAEKTQQVRQAGDAEESDPVSSADATGAPPILSEAGETQDVVVPAEDDAVAEVPIDNATRAAEADSPVVDGRPEADITAEVPEVKAQAVQDEQHSAVAVEAPSEVTDELSETAETAGVVAPVKDETVADAVMEGDTSAGGDAPVDAPPEVEAMLQGHPDEGERPASVAPEPIVGVPNDLPEKGETLPDVVMPLDDDVVADTPIEDGADAGDEAPIDAPVEIAPGIDDVEEVSSVEKLTREAEVPVPAASAAPAEATEELPGVEESAEIVAPAEDDAVAKAPIDDVADAGGDESVDAPSEAAATAEEVPIVQEDRAVQDEQTCSVASEADSEVVGELPETAEAAGVVVKAKDDAVEEAPVEDNPTGGDDAPIDAPAEINPSIDDVAEVSSVEEPTREAEHPVPDDSPAASEAAEESPVVAESAEVVKPVKDDAVADAPIDSVCDTGDGVPVDVPSEGTATAEVPAMEAHGAQTERLASVASGAVSDVADESPQAADTAGGSASSVEDDTVHEAPIEGDISAAEDHAPVNTPVEVDVTMEEHANQTQQPVPVESATVAEVPGEVGATAEVVAPVEGDETVAETPTDDVIGAGGDAPVDAPPEAAATAEVSLVEELTEQEEQHATTTTTVASDAMLEVASELTESGGPAEAVTPMKDDVVAEAPTDDVTAARGNVSVDASPEAAATTEEPVTAELAAPAEQPATTVVASEVISEVASEPSEAGKAVDAATPVEDDVVGEAPSDDITGTRDDPSDEALPKNAAAVIEEAVLERVGEAEQPAPAVSESDSVIADELSETNAGAEGDTALDPPPEVAMVANEPAAESREGDAEQSASKSEPISEPVSQVAEEDELSEEGEMLQDVKDDTIAEESPTDELSENVVGAPSPELATSELAISAPEMEAGEPASATTGKEHEDRNGAPLPAELVGPATATAVGGHADRIAQDAWVVAAGEPPAAGELATRTTPVEDHSAPRSDGREVSPALEEPLPPAREVSPALEEPLLPAREVSPALEEPLSPASEAPPALEEPLLPAREAMSRAPSSAETLELDDASRVDAEVGSVEAPTSVQDAGATGSVTSPDLSPVLTEAEAEAKAEAEAEAEGHVVAMVGGDDGLRSSVEQPTQGTTDVSNNPEGLPLPPTEDAASDDTDPILTVTEVAGPSPEAEPETTDDPKTVGVKQLQGDEETQLAPTPNAENEAVMEGGEHAASSGVEDAGLEQPWSPVDTDGLSPKVDDHPGRATCGETDSVDPDEKAGECVNAITAAAAAVGEAGMGEESLAGGRVPAAAPEAPPSTEEDSPPVVLDSGVPAQNLDETVDGVSSIAGGKDDVDMRRSGTELSSAHEEAVVGATTAEMDEEGSMSLSVDDPSAACTEDSLTAGNSVAVADTEAVADRVSVADNAPVADDVSVADKLSAARGDESATPGVKESAEAAAEADTLTGTLVEKPPGVTAGDASTAAAPESETETSTTVGGDAQSKEADVLPTSGSSTEAQEATAATSSESDPPPSLAGEAEKYGAIGQREPAMDTAGMEAVVQPLHPSVPRDATSDQPAEVVTHENRTRTSSEKENKASVFVARDAEGLEQMVAAENRETNPPEAFEVCEQGLVSSTADERSGYAAKWFRSRVVPCDEPNTLTASLTFFLFFFAFVACLRSSDH